jgi:Ca2+-binding EF-hand superfamily protein
MKKAKWIIPAALATSLVAGVAVAHGGARGASMFERLDLNKDGKITKAEATQARNKWFTEVDTNKDNAITRAEAQKWKEAKWGKKSDGDKSKGAKKDKAKRGRHHGQNGGRMFDRLDQNRDGKITKTEAAAKSNWMFEKLDANKDGVVTKAEAMNARKNWKNDKGKRAPKREQGPKGQGPNGAKGKAA